MVGALESAREAIGQHRAGGQWQELEAGIVLEMVMILRQIPLQHNGHIDLHAQQGADASTRFLRYVEKATCVLRIRLAPQTHRLRIPQDILAHWTEPESRYSMKLLIVCFEHCRNIVLNNQVFSFSEEAIRLSCALDRKWAVLGGLLQTFGHRGPSASRKGVMLAALEAFDQAYTDFEHRFLSELTAIESAALNPLAPVVQASEQIRSLKRYVAHFDPAKQKRGIVDDVEYQDRQRQLMETISRINVVANPGRTGCRCTVETLNELKAVIEQCQVGQPDPRVHKSNPSFMLASHAVEAFNSLCTYLYHIQSCVDRLNPVLCNNKGLQKRLAHLEASWSNARNHVLDPLGRQALETLVADIQRAQIFSPELAEMCEECSADMFLVLPRLTWLSFLASPAKLTPEIQCLLQHRFVEVRNSRGELGCSPGNELRELREQYKHVVGLLASAMSVEALRSPEVSSKETSNSLETTRRQLAAGHLSRRAVLGSGSDLEEYDAMLPSGRRGTEAWEACERFMRDLESWSLELQRHDALNWNKFIAVVATCLNSDVSTVCTDVPAFEI